jgi:hypothetical protein
MKNKMKRWDKNRISYIHLGYDDFYDFDSFVIELLEVLKEKQQYSLLIKINYNKELYAMAGVQIGFKFEDREDFMAFEYLHESLKQRVKDILDNYDVDEISSIQLLYVLIEDMPELKLKNINKINISKGFVNVKDSKDRFNLIPLTINKDYFGKLIINDRLFYLKKINEQRGILNEAPLVVKDTDSIHLYKDNLIIISREENRVIYRSVYNASSGILITEIKDYIMDDNLFNRKIGNVSLSISNDSIVKLESEKKLYPLRSTAVIPKDEANPFIGSWDIEAFDDVDGCTKVYALGFAILGKDSKTYYIDSSITSEQLVLKCINDMLVNELNGYTFYTHNFGRYDSTFLIKILKGENKRLGYEHYITTELSRDNKVIKLTIKVKRSLSDRMFNKDTVRKAPGFNKITIVDSLNILNQSLNKLCTSFEVPVTKGFFPYSFVKRDTLNYVGNTPDHKYWENISLEDYSQLVKPDWSLKDECLKYLNRDLVSLVMVMDKFGKYINRKYFLQITDSLTISRLALNIFFKDYLKSSKLPIINKNMFNDIKKAYYGGVTEVYKPYGTNLFHYDVNSLYPFAALNPIPGINCIFIENIKNSVNLQDLFGFFYCEIKTGDNYLGLLPVHHKEGMIMPNGSWKGWYFTEELKYASENGYTINVIKGYNFNKVNDVFTDYVKDLYQIKSTTKDRVEKDIAKRLLNHLLGRFGLNIVKPITKCVDNKELSIIISSRKVMGKPISITDNDYWITYHEQVDKDICEEHGVDYIKVQNLTPKTDIERLNTFKDVSLTTSAAITAYARIYMSKIKQDILNKGGNIYYTDTDSIVTDIALDNSLVGDELGLFKLEYKIKQAFYISNKTYYADLADQPEGSPSYVVKSKSVKSNSLNLNSFEELYKGNSVDAVKRLGIRDYSRGFVKIVDRNVKLNHDSYTKREKIYKGGNWVDTKPLTLKDGDLQVEKKDGDLQVEKKSQINNIISKNSLFSCLNNIISKNSLFSCLSDIILKYLYGFIVIILCFALQIPEIDFEMDISINEINLDFNLDELVDLRYSDDYMEEPIEVDIYTGNGNRSWMDTFVNLFMDKGNKSCNLYKNSMVLINYSDINTVSADTLDNISYNERPQVLNTILKYQLDSLYNELQSLKDEYSMLEIRKLKNDNIVWDALTMCKKALHSSAAIGYNSPVLGISTSSFENSPLLGSNSPILGRGSSFTGWGVI